MSEKREYDSLPDNKETLIKTLLRLLKKLRK